MALRWAAPEPARLVGAGLAINRARTRRSSSTRCVAGQRRTRTSSTLTERALFGKALAGPVPVRNNHEGDPPGSRMGWGA
jgi:hypothetical protein